MLKEKSCTLCVWKYVAENIVVLTISAQIRSRTPIDISFACFILSWPQRQRSGASPLVASTQQRLVRCPTYMLIVLVVL